jgi:hypothetical protein
MATRDLTGTTTFGRSRAAVAGMIAVVAGLVATIIVAAVIVLGSSASPGADTLNPGGNVPAAPAPAMDAPMLPPGL